MKVIFINALKDPQDNFHSMVTMQMMGHLFFPLLSYSSLTLHSLYNVESSKVI